MSFIKKLLDYVVSISGYFAGAAVTLMLVHVTVDVVGKYLFNSPAPATIVFASNYYMVAIVFLPLAFVERVDAHISVEVLTENFSKGFQRHLRSWTYLLSAAVWGLLACATYGEAMAKLSINTFMMEQGIRIPIWPSHFALPIGYALMTIYLLLRFTAYLMGGDKQEQGDGIDHAIKQGMGE